MLARTDAGRQTTYANPANKTRRYFTLTGTALVKDLLQMVASASLATYSRRAPSGEKKGGPVVRLEK